MRRTGSIVLGAAAALLLGAAAAPTTQSCQEEPASHGDGTTVRMADDCFVPTVLRAPSGSTIGFVNEDPRPHTVTGVGPWGTGHDEVPPDASIQISFPQDGVLVYTCLLHPGMTGAIVIGDASGPGAAQGAAIEIEEGPAAEEDPDPASSPRGADEDPRPADPQQSLPWIVGSLLLGLLVGTILGRTVARRRRH